MYEETHNKKRRCRLKKRSYNRFLNKFMTFVSRRFKILTLNGTVINCLLFDAGTILFTTSTWLTVRRFSLQQKKPVLGPILIDKVALYLKGGRLKVAVDSLFGKTIRGIATKNAGLKKKKYMLKYWKI